MLLSKLLVALEVFELPKLCFESVVLVIYSNSLQSCLRIMAVSALHLAKRACVTLLLASARQYAIPALPITRDSPDKAVLDAFRKVARKVHPDKGGFKSGAQKLNAA